MDELLTELQPDLERLIAPLFEASELFVRASGAFLPHGALLFPSDDVGLAVAGDTASLGAVVSSNEILPFLHEALRAAVAERETKAVAVCEDVTVAVEGEPDTKAIKVLVEHRRGLCVAFYVLYREAPEGGWEFGEMLTILAEPEVRPEFRSADPV